MNTDSILTFEFDNITIYSDIGANSIKLVLLNVNLVYEYSTFVRQRQHVV